MKGLSLIALLALAACGVDGPPVAPSAQGQPEPGLSISGEARIGVVTSL